MAAGALDWEAVREAERTLADLRAAWAKAQRRYFLADNRARSARLRDLQEAAHAVLRGEEALRRVDAWAGR